jgi:hypothetical protein
VIYRSAVGGQISAAQRLQAIHMMGVPGAQVFDVWVLFFERSKN